MSEARRWSKFWWQDWQRDPALRMCSLAARGLWMELLCIAHEGTPYGHVTVNGRPLSPAQIAGIVGAKAKEKEVLRLLEELEFSGVFSKTPEGTIFSRRMIRDKKASDDGKENIAKRWPKPQTTNETPPPPPSSPPNRGPTNGATDPSSSPPNRVPSRGPNTLEAEAEEVRKNGLRPPPPADAVAASPPDARALLWSEGLATYRRLTGKLEGQARGRIGRLVRDAGDNCAIVLAALQDCPFTPEADAWLTKAVQARASPKQKPDRMGYLDKYDGELPGDEGSLFCGQQQKAGRILN